MSTYKLVVSPPEIVDREFVLNTLCGPGPCNLWPSVQEALSKPVIQPLEDEYYNVTEDIRIGLQYVFQTKTKLVLAVSGAGHAGMETVITNLVAPNETLLIATRGLWDQRAHTIATRFGIKTEITRVPLNATFTLEHLEAELKRVRPTALFITHAVFPVCWQHCTHGDSSTGTVQKIEGLGKICHKYGALLIVDTVVSLAAVPFLMDEWEVDAAYSASQKAFSGPAGISPVAFSARAEHQINNRKHEPSFYFDVKLLAPQWNCYGNTRIYHHTLSPPLLWALRACLREIIKESLPNAWERHAATALYFHKRLEECDIQVFVPKPVDRLPTVTTVILPKGYTYPEFLKFIKEKHNIVIFGGIGPTVGKTLRIGLMGINSTHQIAESVIQAMLDALKTLKKSSL